MGFILVCLVVILLVLWNKEKKKNKSAEQKNEDLNREMQTISEQIDRLRKYEGIADVDDEIKTRRERCDEELEEKRKAVEQEITDSRTAATEEIESNKARSKEELQTARQEAKAIRERAKQVLDKANNDADYQVKEAGVQAKQIINDAEAKAKEIAGEAYEIAGKSKELEKIATAMKNVIKGYGTQYLIPSYSLLDDLASDFGHTEAGEELKRARENTLRMVRAGLAATCDYVESNRRETAIAFVIDAFNGKVDSILTKTKKDNYGILEQKIKDAYELVNHNGAAFRNARIAPEYLAARLEELRWGTIVTELKVQAQEEQKRLREQIREEERARKEYEKAIKEAAKEEEMLRKAMEKAQQQLASANEAKKAEYEAKLAALQNKLKEVEERGQRALSMAQQTKHGNVYVISNIGSFGENVYKVGMTRRLEPMDRVKELGDASVPFPFDVHAIIETDDAPKLESDLHRALALMQMNKVNPRKEFFKTTLNEIRILVEKMGLKASWTLEAEAAEYRETLAIEERMKNDPEAKKKWEEYAASIAEENVSEEEN